MRERLQKILSRAGVASRREAERMLADGRVMVNGAVITEPGTKADPGKDAIRIDGKRLQRLAPATVTIALHKPRGVVSTRSDPEGRPTVVDLVRGVPGRLYPVGRLDYNAEGLLLLTNDGDLAYALLRPGGAERTYRVKVRGEPSQEALSRLRKGIVLDGRRTLPARVRKIHTKLNTWLEIGLHEGKKNQIIRMCQAIGHPVSRLRRVKIGPIALGTLPRGRHRVLRPGEVAALRAACLDERRAASRKAVN